MNYLAHALLSLDDKQIQIGNLIADFVKGKKYLLYPIRIQLGILLHRRIDAFTDAHPLVSEAKKLFKPTLHRGSGVFIDILFDHFLAKDKRYFPRNRLAIFTQEIYTNLLIHEHLLNEEMIHYFGFMQKQDWLFQYQYSEGLQRSIHGMCKRYPVLGNADVAIEIINKNYENLLALYTNFFPLLNTQITVFEEEVKDQIA